MTRHHAIAFGPGARHASNTLFPLRCIARSAALFVTAATLCAQGTEAPSQRGFTFGVNAQGSANALGTVTKLDASAGYFFGRFWQVDFGVPYYFVNPSDSASAISGSKAGHGVGNVYTQIRFTHARPVLNYMSTLTATAPTGDRDAGLTTGRVTVDWGNLFDRSFGRFTPFAELGIANAVSDTTFFVRPYTTLGFIARGQAGARYRLAPWISLGASGYLIEPAGGQTVISRLVTTRRNQDLPSPPVSGSARGLLNRPVFETTTVTTGNAAIARDRGVSAYLVFGRNPGANLYVGYTRSTQFHLNTLFFGIGYNVRKAAGGI